MWSDLRYYARNTLKSCITKEELAVAAAKLSSDVGHPWIYRRDDAGLFVWEKDERPLRVRAGEAMFYARLGAELARDMDAEGYGDDPRNDALRFYNRSGSVFYRLAMELETRLSSDLRRRLLAESGTHPVRLTREEIAERLNGVGKNDPLCLSERVVLAYLYDPDFPVPKAMTEAERILDRARHAYHPLPPDDAGELTGFLREEIETMKPARAPVRRMADRIDRHFGVEDHGEVHRKLSYLFLDLLAVPEDPYQPLRRIDALFKGEQELLTLLEKQV